MPGSLEPESRLGKGLQLDVSTRASGEADLRVALGREVRV
jgi:hypothetical protein